MNNHGEALALIVGMALISFATRYPALLFVKQVALPKAVTEALQYVPVAVLMAMVAPAIFAPASELDVGLDNPYLVAGIAAVGIAWWKRHVFLTMGTGMLVFFLWRWLVG